MAANPAIPKTTTKKWTVGKRIRFALQAYKNAHRAWIGIPIAVEYELTCLPSHANEVLKGVTLVTINEKGNREKISLSI